MIGDRHPACGPYQSTTNRGDQQTVSEIAFVDLPGAKDAIAWTCRVDVAGVTAYAGVIQIVSMTGNGNLFYDSGVFTAGSSPSNRR